MPPRIYLISGIGRQDEHLLPYIEVPALRTPIVVLGVARLPGLGMFVSKIGGYFKVLLELLQIRRHGLVSQADACIFFQLNLFHFQN